MRSIAIVGAGQSGALLALALLKRDFEVTLVTDRTPDEVRVGPVMSSQCMFDSALQIERDLGLDRWEERCPRIDTMALTVAKTHSSNEIAVTTPLIGFAQSVDQRVKCADWVDEFTELGGNLIIKAASPMDIENLAQSHDLVIISSGKGDLGRLFPPDPVKSPYNRPQRALALAYVNGLAPHPDGADLSLNIVPGVGEYFVLPALTTTGPCHVMVFEGVPGGPMDCWDDVHTPREHLERAKEVLAEHFPAEFARTGDISLTDEAGVLRGRLTPTVRRPVAELASGSVVLGMADAVVLNDPLTGQGSNNAAQAVAVYLDAIVDRDDRPFDAQWMQRTFDKFWRGWAQWAVSWTNDLLRGPSDPVLGLFAAAQDSPTLASAIATGFDDPRTVHNWWFDDAESQRVIETARAAEQAQFDPRDLRRALGQYATGVTVITARAPDGRKIGVTANSFTSVSMDPPLVSWCPASKAPSLPDLTAATHFAVNVLAANQHDLSRQFSTPAEDKFAGVATTEGIAGVPLIDDAIAHFQCRTVQRVKAGDHIIFLGEIEQYDADPGEPLVFHSGSYRLVTKHPDF
ncbi:styrene monooxygenase/indole monooxygenase family protein [Rhodococcus opacus]|uniref:Flavin reductase n=1 Tax=Rhodococcus opacus TaxID=37919 RepID=A0AAX3YNF7_RHOOP|nr:MULTISPECIES: styrene monooxygenase/indole monooxygenase family protein [Rhodococcus]MCZ4584547.1 flavin reductase [Rhodococcus opacus]MDI9938522.1 flavin reductase [Rhodococcus sp. IEGM 1351]MDJ0417467.1 flavin reductase [Rhodococcus opacus]MDV6241901.1 styrene monooxygenase/indole monooxygenase family protein [Rhodococcus opacus]QZS56116.1 flavin reductase [Rhodococcus opacus]